MKEFKIVILMNNIAMNKTKWKNRLFLILLNILFIIFLTATLAGELALTICGAIHFGMDIFNISDGGAITMIVIGVIMFILETSLFISISD